jgi:hypothetical protein
VDLHGGHRKRGRLVKNAHPLQPATCTLPCEHTHTLMHTRTHTHAQACNIYTPSLCMCLPHATSLPPPPPLLFPGPLSDTRVSVGPSSSGAGVIERAWSGGTPGTGRRASYDFSASFGDATPGRASPSPYSVREPGSGRVRFCRAAL